MAETRLRGQEVVLRLARGGNLEATLTAIKDFTISFDIASIEAQYLGETEKRFDDIAHGCSGSFGIDLEGPELFTLVQFLLDRAARRADVNEAQVNATARLEFPDGRIVRIVIKDLKFDAIPVASPGRDQYVNATFNYKAGLPRIIS